LNPQSIRNPQSAIRIVAMQCPDLVRSSREPAVVGGGDAVALQDDRRRQAEPAAARTIDPSWPLRIAREKLEVDRVFAALRAEGGDSSSGVVEMGLRLLTKFFP